MILMEEIKFLVEIALRRGLPPGIVLRLLRSVADFLRRNPEFLKAPGIMARFRDEAPQSILLIVTENGRVRARVLLAAGPAGYSAAMLPAGDGDYREFEGFSDFSDWMEAGAGELLGARGLPDAAARIDARVFDIVREDLLQYKEEDPLYVFCRALLRALRLRLIDLNPAPFQFDVFSEISAEEILYRFRERFGFHAARAAKPGRSVARM